MAASNTAWRGRETASPRKTRWLYMMMRILVVSCAIPPASVQVVDPPAFAEASCNKQPLYSAAMYNNLDLQSAS